MHVCRVCSPFSGKDKNMAKNAAVPKRKFKKEWLKGYLFILPNFVGFLIFMGIPIIMGLIISFTNYDGFKTFDFVGLSNYVKMFKDEYFQVSFVNNLIYTGVTVPCTILIALLLAVALNVGIKGTGLFRTMFFFPNISSMVAVGIVWSMIFHPTRGPLNLFLYNIGVTNPPQWLVSSKTALLSVMIVAVWKQAGYYMVMILAGLQSIPKQLYEAAEIDGANAEAVFSYYAAHAFAHDVYGDHTFLNQLFPGVRPDFHHDGGRTRTCHKTCWFTGFIRRASNT